MLHAGGVAERRVLGDVLDALAVDPVLAPVAQGLEELGAGEGEHGRIVVAAARRGNCR